MLQLVIMPMEFYNVLIECCPESCPEYELLKNGFIIRNEEGEQEVRIVCGSARLLVDFAAERCPEVVSCMRTIRTTPDAVLRPGTGQASVEGYPNPSWHDHSFARSEI